MDGNTAPGAGGCPVMHGTSKSATFGVRSNRDWWPNQLNLRILHQNSPLTTDPLGAAFRTMPRRSRRSTSTAVQPGPVAR